jgi:hypothetical protein
MAAYSRAENERFDGENTALEISAAGANYLTADATSAFHTPVAAVSRT